MSGHTPEPWTIEPDRNEQLNIYGGDGHFWIALLPHQCVGSIEAEQKANACLIATAPKLLAALKHAAEWLRSFQEPMMATAADIDLVRDAHVMAYQLETIVAKAEGVEVQA